MANFLPPGTGHFRLFAKNLEHILKGLVTDQSQKKQVEGLVRLEKQFRKELCSHPAGHRVFKAFMVFILDEKKNILSARPYFRERQRSFSARVSPALKARNAERLHKFGFNYLFVQFALKVYKGPRRKALREIARQIQVARDELIQRNLPLAINRAKLFWNKVPKADRDYLDYVQMCAEGLISAVDKFVLPYRTVFRSVAIGRMTGNMTEASSDTVMHFYPSDKRLLYKANLIMHRHHVEGLDKVVAIINETKKPVVRATQRRINMGLEVWVRDVLPGSPPGHKYRLEVTALPEEWRQNFLNKKIGEIVDRHPVDEIRMEILEMYEIITESRLSGILRGSSHVSMDATLNLTSGSDPESSNPESVSVHSKMADPTPTVEDRLSKQATSGILRDGFDTKLTVLEQKVLTLRGEYYE